MRRKHQICSLRCIGLFFCIFLVLSFTGEPRLAKADTQNSYFALIIENSSYMTEWPSLKSRRGQISKLSGELHKKGYQIKRLLNADPEHIRKTIEWFITTYASKTHSLLVVYSGHTYTDSDGNGCIVAHNTNLPRKEVGLEGEDLITFKEIVKQLQDADVANTLLLVDSSTSIASPLLQLYPQTGEAQSGTNDDKFTAVLGAGADGEAEPVESIFLASLIATLENVDATQQSGFTFKQFYDSFIKTAELNSWQRPWAKISGSHRLTASTPLFSNLQKASKKRSLLFIDPSPKNARVRILNIRPKYDRNGLELPPGNYKVEVSADGHETIVEWVKLHPSEALNFPVNLPRIAIAAVPPEPETKVKEPEADEETLSSDMIKEIEDTLGEEVIAQIEEPANTEKNEDTQSSPEKQKEEIQPVKSESSSKVEKIDSPIAEPVDDSVAETTVEEVKKEETARETVPPDTELLTDSGKANEDPPPVKPQEPPPVEEPKNDFVIPSNAPVLSAQEKSLGINLIPVKRGTFSMGGRRYNEGPIHEKTIFKDFYVMETEVTVRQYAEFIKATGKGNGNSIGSQYNNDPVVNVSWQDARDFARWLSSICGRKYRLPTEAEWEYAARLGMPQGIRSIEDPGKIERRLMPVQRAWKNTLGIYGMPGNVWEWTSDCWVERYGSNKGTSNSCKNRVIRGGSWRDSQKLLTASSRNGVTHQFRTNTIGFRLVSNDKGAIDRGFD